MNTLSVWVAVGLVCMLTCHTLAGNSTDGESEGSPVSYSAWTTACLPDEDPRCRNANNKAELNGVKYCCPRGAGSISTSSSNINGVQKDSCKCGGRVKMPEMPKFDWPGFDSPFPWKI